MSDDKTTQFFGRLTLPTNPEFDLLTDSGAVDYTPPATLANYIILYTNAAIELNAQVVAKTKRVEKLRMEQKQAQRALDRFKKDLLARHPAPTSAAKNLMLTEAYVRLLATNDATVATLDELEDAVAKFDDAIDVTKAEVESLKFTMNTIRLACDNIMTHLSYVKTEAKLAGHQRV